MKFSLLLCSILLPLLVGCEELVDPVGLPYNERIVVRSILMPGDPALVSLTRTLPLQEPYSEEKAKLLNVTGSITDEETGTVYPLVKDTGTMYIASDLRPESGHRYTLRAEWNGRKISATTRIPYPVVLDSAKFTPSNGDDEYDDEFKIEVWFKPQGDQVYILSQGQEAFRRDSIRQYYVYNTFGNADIARLRDTLPTRQIHLVSESAYYGVPRDSNDVKLNALLYTFDTPYYDFYMTYYSYANDAAVFSNGTDVTRWNIQGDGIGLFIGRALTAKEVW